MTQNGDYIVNESGQGQGQVERPITSCSSCGAVVCTMLSLYFGHGLDRIVELDRTLVYELMPRLFILDFF